MKAVQVPKVVDSEGDNEVADGAVVADQPRSFAADDPARPVIGRAVRATLIAAVVFELYAYLTKFTVRSVYVHTPWMNDPYDTFVTFAVFFVPLAFLVTAIRIPLCRSDQPLPVGRARDLLRCGRLILVIVLATVMAEWAAVPLGANRASWSGATGVAIGLLTLVSLVTAVATISVVKAAPKIPRRRDDAAAPDWLGDLLLAIRQESRRLGPLGKNADGLTRWLEERVLARVRRHPLLAGAILAVLFGLALATDQAIGEGIPLGQVFVFYFTAGTCTMYAFLVIGGRYLDMVRSDRRSMGMARRFYDALVMGCAAIPAAVAFRFSLWSAVGARGENLEQIWVLFLVAFASIFAIGFAVETVTGLHGGSKVA